MKTTMIVCETLKDEFLFLYREMGLKADVKWIESGLHNYTQKLHDRLQQAIDEITECGRVILVFGRCGDSISNLKNGNFEMIVPKAEDCISLLMGSDERRRDYSREHAAYYLTDGWIRGERNIWMEYLYSVEKYGEATAKNIAKMMYCNYRTLALLDTGINPISQLMEKTREIEETLELERKVVPAELTYIRELLTGPWDTTRYEIVPPYGIVGRCGENV